MLKKVKTWFTDNSPRWFFSLIAKIYWKLHPDRMSISFEFVKDEDLGKHWYVKRKANDIRMHFPSRGFIYNMAMKKNRPYHKFLKLKEGSIVFDVGACIGCDTLAMSREIGEGGLVVSIEPGPLNLQYLERNVRGNNLKNVKIIEKAAWSCEELLELYLTGFGSHSCFPGVAGQGGKRKIMIEGESLDNIASKLGIDEVELIKMNIEGAEIEALEGAEEVLEGTSRVLVQAHKRDGEWTTDKVVSFLENRGFTVSLDKLDRPYVLAVNR